MAYFSNGSDGYILDKQCADCPLGDGPCPVALIHAIYNYDQIDVPKLREAMNMLVNEEGICQMRYPIRGAAGYNKKESETPIPVMPAMKEWAEKHGLKVTTK